MHGAPRGREPPLADTRIAALERALGEQTRISLELRRELFTKTGELAAFTAAQLAATEAAIEAKTGAIDAQIEAMHLHLAAAEARLPADGALVKQGFLNIEK